MRMVSEDEISLFRDAKNHIPKQGRRDCDLILLSKVRKKIINKVKKVRTAGIGALGGLVLARAVGKGTTLKVVRFPSGRLKKLFTRGAKRRRIVKVVGISAPGSRCNPSKVRRAGESKGGSPVTSSSQRVRSRVGKQGIEEAVPLEALTA